MQDPMEPLLYCHLAEVAASIRACHVELSELVQSKPHSRTAAHPRIPQGVFADSGNNKDLRICSVNELYNKLTKQPTYYLLN